MNKERAELGIAGGIFLIGIGVLIMTGFWWPGILFVIGLALAADHAFHRRYVQALMAFVVCLAVGLIFAINVPWKIYGPFILISFGIVVLTRNVLFKQS
ncbi:MAG: hypothetical protein DCC56_14435 [Anaerolineae bacterium]|nr:MAG: hypothetical protein DCC56_14435 [Anaerolineae bacterium]WKZ44363.1 MAG: hypothetical protein QY302_01065 [Anaerolineales bacterium]